MILILCYILQFFSTSKLTAKDSRFQKALKKNINDVIH